MKIAFFVNQFPMLSEAFIATSAAALRDSGNDVDIYGFGGETPTGSSVDQATARKLEGRGRNAVLPSTMAEHARAAPKAFASVLSGSGLRAVNVFNPLVYRRSIKNLSPLYQAAMFRNGRDYDILHCQFATLGEFVLKHKRAGLLGGKMVIHFRGYDISQVVKACGPRVYEKLFAGADYFVANCEHFRQKAIEIGCPPDRIDVVGSGIELSNFPFRGAKPRDGGAIRIVTVGRLIERKGVHVALDAPSPP